MDIRQIVYGIVLFIIFWAFQAGYAGGLGTVAWFLGAILFIAFLWLYGKAVVPKWNTDQTKLWTFSVGVVLIGTIFPTFLTPYIPGIVLPPGEFSVIVPPILLSFWLVVFGGAMFVAGSDMKNSIVTLTGIIWLFTSITFVLNAGPNAFMHFAIVTSLPFILSGVVSKNKAK